MNTLVLLWTWRATIKKWWPVFQALVSVAEAIQKVRGGDDVQSMADAAAIQFRLRLPTPDEERVMFDRGFQKDPNNIFPWVQS